MPEPTVKTNEKNTSRPARQGLKTKVSGILKAEGPDTALNKLEKFSPPKVINTLFSLLYDLDQEIKWSAVTLMGKMVAQMAETNMEAARIIVRRLMWNLNDESGGIGWGSPEAMAEILSRQKALAKEYTPILISYSRKDGNFLEHETLQQGLLWGIGRLASVRPHLLQDASCYLVPYLESSDPTVRGLTTWVLGKIHIKEDDLSFAELLKDNSEVQIYIDPDIKTFRIKDLAVEAARKYLQAVALN